ncbi:MAG: helix-turn-helix domain-containing protein [Bacteroidota bacterium]
MKNVKTELQENEIMSRLIRIEKILKGQQRKPLTITQASEYTGLSISFLYKLTSNGKLKFYKPNGKIIYFSKKNLDRYIFRNAQNQKT